MSIQAPAGYPAVAKRLLRDLGIDTERFYTAFHQDLYGSLGLGSGYFLAKETFGSDYLAVGDLADPEMIRELPISGRGKRDLLRLGEDAKNYVEDMETEARLEYLNRTSYERYLRDKADIGDEAINVVAAMSRGVWAIGIDAFPAAAAWSSGYPGFGDLELPFYSYADESDEPFIFHFPDGNASIARMLVRAMVPDSAPGNDMEDIVTARFDYGALDDPDNAVRIRLNSTVVRARHQSERANSPVAVTYVRDGAAHTVTGRRVVMACYHAIVPHLCPELPDEQRAALSSSVRAPLVYTNVAIRNWTSFVKLGVHRVTCPGSFYHNVRLDFPVSLGSYRFPTSPDEPIVLHMNHVPGEPGLGAREQFQAGKRKLLATPFETFEYHARDQLGRMLGPGGFDPAEDIAAITVNRWPHGYAYSYDGETDRIAFFPTTWPTDRQSWRQASRRFGNISFAGTDAASNAMSEAAIEEAHRAVTELLNDS